jgi:phosphoribosylformimino-5-aminoimidazole carboxamide ribotide isomerase
MGVERYLFVFAPFRALFRIQRFTKGTRPMQLYPAIDLKAGQCVRLLQGDLEQVTVYADDPAAQASTWAEAGFSWLHLVDLDGAVGGRSVNGDTVRAILTAVNIPVQLGGGIRSLADIERWLGAGIRRVILGTIAVREPALAEEACRQFPQQVVIGIDARDGAVAVAGWREGTALRAVEVAQRYQDVGAAAVIFTDIGRDGTLTGVNVMASTELARATTLPVIASGGVGSCADITALMAVDPPAPQGVILGRALYDGRIDPAQAIAVARGGGRTG